jgi:hypothetical protein
MRQSMIIARRNGAFSLICILPKEDDPVCLYFDLAIYEAAGLLYQ